MTRYRWESGQAWRLVTASFHRPCPHGDCGRNLAIHRVIHRCGQLCPTNLSTAYCIARDSLIPRKNFPHLRRCGSLPWTLNFKSSVIHRGVDGARWFLRSLHCYPTPLACVHLWRLQFSDFRNLPELSTVTGSGRSCRIIHQRARWLRRKSHCCYFRCPRGTTREAPAGQFVRPCWNRVVWDGLSHCRMLPHSRGRAGGCA